MNRSESDDGRTNGGGADAFPDAGDRYQIVGFRPPSIYHALDRELGRPVALKPLPGHGPVDAGPPASLVHPNIVTTYDLFEHEGQWYVVLEWVDGGSLRTLLDENPQGLDVSVAVEIARKLAGALHHVHGWGLVHGDIRPGNILMDQAHQPKLKGFAGPQQLSQPIPTPEAAERDPYLAPERAAGEPADSRTDIYQLGVLLTEMLTGHPAEDAEVPSADLPAGLQRLLGRALAQRPEERPDAASMLSALVALTYEPPAPRSPGLPRSSPPHVRRRSALLLTALLIAGIAAAAIGAVLLYPSVTVRREPAATATPTSAPRLGNGVPGVPYSAASLLDALERMGLRARPTGERACEAGAVPGLVYQVEGGARFVLWVYPSQSVLRQDWAVAAGRAPAPRAGNCYQDTGLRYWNANLVLVFPDRSTNAEVRTRITSAFLNIR